MNYMCNFYKERWSSYDRHWPRRSVKIGTSCRYSRAGCRTQLAGTTQGMDRLLTWEDTSMYCCYLPSPVAEWGEGRRTAGGGGSGPSHQECEAAIRLLQKEKEQKAHEVCVR